MRCFTLTTLPILLSFLLLVASALSAQQPSPSELIQEASEAVQRGELDKAAKALERYLEQRPDDPWVLTLQAELREDTGDYVGALESYEQLFQAAPTDPRRFLLRGQALFKVGRIQDSLADFDSFIEEDPAALPHLWQRGIALYYADRFAECKDQFDLHRTVNPNDVENAAWHYLCVARLEGSEAAARQLLPVGDDSRVPLPEIYSLYQGKLQPQDVLSAAQAYEIDAEEQRDALFYAHLYIALLAEVQGSDAVARNQMKAADELDFPYYMGAVATVHRQLRSAGTN